MHSHHSALFSSYIQTLLRQKVTFKILTASPHKAEHSKLSTYINWVCSYYWLNITEVLVFTSSQYQDNDFVNLRTYCCFKIAQKVTSPSFIMYGYSLLKLLLLIRFVSFPQQVNRNVLKLSLVRSLNYSNTITFLAIWPKGWHYHLLCEQTSNFRSFSSPIGQK